LVTAGALAVTGTGLAIAAHLRNNVRHDLPLTAALNGELRYFTSSAGRVGYYVAKPAKRGLPPILLVHSINAAASSYEMQPLFEHYAKTRKVIAIDLPGFGFSDRRARDYTPELYRDVILDVLARECKNEAVDVIALSLGCEFAALAAQMSPAQFRRMVFLSPTGMSSPQIRRTNDFLLKLLNLRMWRQIFFDALTSRYVLTLFLRLSQRMGFNAGLANYCYETSHQPNAFFAPLYFIAGKLFSSNMLKVYGALKQPCLALFGNDAFSRNDLSDELHNLPNWRLLQLRRCGALIHFDDPATVFAQIDKHFAQGSLAAA
jgi:pimeloyl-ACP methyl ester carboxylesterase